jgi:tetratricopeptide (TPR) repeat protein
MKVKWNPLRTNNYSKFIFILFLFFTEKSFCNQNGDYNQGIQAFQQGDFLVSEKLLLGVKENFPHAKYLLGLIEEKKESYLDALKYFNDFINNLNSTDDLYYAVKAHQAYCYSFSDDEKNAKILLDEIISKNIVDKNVNFITAAAALHIGEITQNDEYANDAALTYKLILDNVNPNDSDALNGYGRSYLLLFDISKKNKKTDKKYLITALHSICTAIEKRPAASFYNNLGAIYYKMDDWKSAEKSFSLALEKAGTNQLEIEKIQKNLAHIRAMEKKFPIPKITPIICNSINQKN